MCNRKTKDMGNCGIHNEETLPLRSKLKETREVGRYHGFFTCSALPLLSEFVNCISKPGVNGLGLKVTRVRGEMVGG